MSIEVKGVSKFYGNQKAVDNVSFTIKSGEIAGFLGPNGAGKSTLMKIITGYIPASEGTVLVNNTDINVNPIGVKKMIGYLPEHNPLYLSMFVKEYLQFTSKLYTGKSMNKKAMEHIIDITGLEIEQHKKIGALSKGYRQRVGLAQALIHNPQVLILDEPTTGLDPNQIIEIRNLIKTVGKEKTVMLSTHIMQEVEAICDRILIINSGKIIADGNNATQLTEENFTTVMVEFDVNPSEADLAAITHVTKVVYLNNTNWLLQSGNIIDIRPLLFQFAVSKGLTVLSMQKQEKRLEDVFRELTGKK